MLLPESIEFTDGNAGLPESGIYLHGFSNTGESVTVQTRQTGIPDLDFAGRLFFNNELVEQRSATEAEIISLLNSADFADELRDVPLNTMDYKPGPITGKESLARLRDKLAAYLQSDGYLKVATQGPKSNLRPWKLFL